jgi:hypothetical protein
MADLELHAQQSAAEVLKAAQAGKRHVFVHLRGGKEYSAYVKDVGPASVVLEKPTGREFYLVHVRLDAVDSVEVRAREK